MEDAQLEIDIEQISDGLKAGLLSLIPCQQKGKRKLSKIYEKNAFQKIMKNNEVLDGLVACSICLKVFIDDKKNGTAIFIRHMNNCLQD